MTNIPRWWFHRERGTVPFTDSSGDIRRGRTKILESEGEGISWIIGHHDAECDAFKIMQANKLLTRPEK